jgi:hypothetical protein
VSYSDFKWLGLAGCGNEGSERPKFTGGYLADDM